MMRDYSERKIGPLTMDEVHSKDLLVEMEANFWVLDTDHSVVKLLQQRIVRWFMAIKGGVNDDTRERNLGLPDNWQFRRIWAS